MIKDRWNTRAVRLALVVGVTLAAAAAAAAGPFFSAWSTAQKIDEIAGNHADLNTPSLDGCPIQSPDGLSLYMASNRPGGRGGLDIWVASRTSTSGPWGEPVNLPEPINSAADDFCPTPIHGNGLLFVSRRVITGVTCGMGDIYFTRRNPARGWSDPDHLGCDPAGPNSALDEQGPSYVQGRLYFSRSSATVPGDLYVSAKEGDMSFGAATAIAELNDAGANDIQPNVREDGREIVFSSNRAGGAGGQDIWTATREHVDGAWSAASNLGAAVNTSAAETRPSLSRDAQQLLFGRAPAPEGMSDIYVSTREKRGVTGTARNDSLVGTDGDDRLFGLGGNDTLRGLAGRDYLGGGPGRDRLFGGADNDRLVGGPGANTLAGDAGDDLLTGGLAPDTLAGGLGNDRLYGGGGNDRLSGGLGNDTLVGGTGVNRYAGGFGDDVVNARNGRRETVNCGPGRDRVRADRFDRLRGCERRL